VSTNNALLVKAASHLKPLLPEIVFVGGCTTGMLITDPAAAPVRVTTDADVIAEISSYQEYIEFSERLLALGFVEDHREGAPLCRWNHGRLTVDVMPLDDKVLGFSNRWYAGAVASSVHHVLENGAQIRVVTAQYFLATKFEAFQGRGNGDFLLSHDLEDIITVIDGRPELASELEQAEPELRQYVGEQIDNLLSSATFVNALEGFLPVRSSLASASPVSFGTVAKTGQRTKKIGARRSATRSRTSAAPRGAKK
jgi:hypothetical protein